MTDKLNPDFMYNWIREKSGKTTKMENKQMTMWTCQFCGKDTSNVEYDYLNGYDHLSCALEADNKARANEFEHCILCGVETSVKIGTHIDMRIGYVEGAGQLCSKCYNRGTEHGAIAVDYNTILGTPNDQELGAKVRKLYWERKN
jgi:hypothetical protein